MSFEQRVRTYLSHKAASLHIPPRSISALLKGARLDDALGDLRTLSSDETAEDQTPRRRWWRQN